MMKPTITKLLFSLSCLFYVTCATAQNDILLKNYRPVSIYHTPRTEVAKASYPVIDMHSHDYAPTPEEITRWVATMDEVGVKKTVILTCSTESRFDSIVERYGKYPDHFLFYCGFDYSGFGKPGWTQKAIAELQRCYEKGARGVGELGDKGEGELYSGPMPGVGIHIDNSTLKPLLQKCSELKMPVIIHVAEDQWMYEAPDSTNDGLMNSAHWHVNMLKPGKLGHDELLASLENAVKENPNTLFVACHFANSCANLDVLGGLFDKYPNLFADIAARYAEVSPVPNYTAAFMTKYQDRLVYGTDMGDQAKMYRITFRILESADEHFYEIDQFGYHWPLYGLHLPGQVLQKLYSRNAEKIISYQALPAQSLQSR